MKKILLLIALGISLLAQNLLPPNQTVIGPDVIKEIEEILENPVPVYELDLAENDAVFKLMDGWFNQFVKFEEADRLETDRAVIFKLEAQKNVPLLPPRQPGEGVSPPKEFVIIWYFQEPQFRGFLKEIRVPSDEILPVEEVVDHGRRFITEWEFINTPDDGLMVNPIVLSRKRHRITLDKEDIETQLLLQRVEFSREFQGLEVINSKQIVDIHPDSREILSYKSINWTPINEKSARNIPYITIDEIISILNSYFRRSESEHEVAGVKAGMYQSESFIFPVIVFYTTETGSLSKTIPEERAIVVSLVGDLGIEAEQRKLEYPSKSEYRH